MREATATNGISDFRNALIRLRGDNMQTLAQILILAGYSVLMYLLFIVMFALLTSSIWIVESLI
jgi:hypothetical protein